VKQIVKAVKLLLILFVCGTIAVLVTVNAHPVKQASAAACDAIGAENCLLDQPINQIDPCKTDKTLPSCNPVQCTDPDVEGCLPGCSLNSDEVCVPDPTPTPTPSQDTPPQVLGISTTAAVGGK
jgi:hypothetical protein